MSFPRYPKYKPSGVEWLGDVPAHWAVAALAYRYRVELGKMLDAKQISGEHLLPYVRNADVQWGRINTDDLNCMDFAPEERERFRLKAGDLLVCEGGEVGRCAVWDAPITECFYQKAIHRLRTFDPATDEATFLRWVLEAAVRRGCFASSESKATIAHLPAETFRRHRFAFPPLPEQRAISAFLDRETAKIDRLVAEQRRLIELLKEKRQAVISHAVTKGLDLKAPMKPSGVEWLGDVPAHWEVKRLEHISEFVWGKAHEQFVDDAGQHFCVTARFVSTNGEATKYCTTNLTPAQRGDILMVMSDLPNGRALARAFLVMDDRSYAINQRVCAVRLLQGKPTYFAMQLDRNRRLLAEDDGANQTHLSNHDFTKLTVLFPPPAEQERIGAAIGALRTRFDALAAEAESAIALLQERRSALISAAVTGQIDIRNAATTEAA